MKKAIETLSGSVEEKLAAISSAISAQTNTLTEKLALIKGAVDAGLVGEDSTLSLVKKAIEALNSTTATANEKLEAIRSAIDSPTSSINVKLEAIKSAVAQGVADVAAKQDLIITALNSMSSYTFTKDELLETADDHLLVDAAFWDANHDNYEVARALKALLPLHLSHRYKFYYKQDSGKYPLSDYESTSFYGPLWEEGKILKSILNPGEVILAADLATNSTAPVYKDMSGHRCYYLKKVHKSCTYVFQVSIGARAKGKTLKVKSMSADDTMEQESDYIVYSHKSEAEKATTGVWGFKGLKYDRNAYPSNSVDFLFVNAN